MAQAPRVLNTGHHRNERDREWSSYQIVSLIYSLIVYIPFHLMTIPSPYWHAMECPAAGRQALLFGDGVMYRWGTL